SRVMCLSYSDPSTPFSFHASAAPRGLHSFPTRRSSDLEDLGGAVRGGAGRAGRGEQVDVELEGFDRLVAVQRRRAVVGVVTVVAAAEGAQEARPGPLADAHPALAAHGDAGDAVGAPPVGQLGGDRGQVLHGVGDVEPQLLEDVRPVDEQVAVLSDRYAVELAVDGEGVQEGCSEVLA